MGQARGWGRWLFRIPAIAMPVLGALSRIYRGEHHPTDILGSLLFSALWLTATTLLIKPNANSRRARNQPGPMRRAALPGRQSAAQPAGPRPPLPSDLSPPRPHPPAAPPPPRPLPP